MLPLVSVVIPMRNEEASISACISSVLSQDYPTDRLEILVVDGMSDDRSTDIVCALSQKYPNIRLLRNPKRITPVALNIGIKNARGRVILILGAHSFLERDYISLGLSLMEQQKADCVGGREIGVGETFMQKAISLTRYSLIGGALSPYRYSSKAQFVNTANYGLYKREVFDMVGLYDETLVRNQDNDFNSRVNKAGYKVFFSPEMKAYYMQRATAKSLSKQLFRDGWWQPRVFVKNIGSLRDVTRVVPSVFILLLIALGLGALFSYSFGVMFVMILTLYFLLLGAFSLYVALRNGWRFLFVLPFVFMLIHFSFGTGFLAGTIALGAQWLRLG